MWALFSMYRSFSVHIGGFFGLVPPPPTKGSAGPYDDQIIVTTANIARKMAPTLTQILIFKHNFHKEV